MADASDLWVIQGAQVMGIGESKTFSVDFTRLGTPSPSPLTMNAYDAAGTDTPTTLGGSMSVAGTVVTLQEFTPNALGVWRLVIKVDILGNDAFGVLDVAVVAVIPVTAAVASGSYGTLDGVAALAPRNANRGGAFDDTTRPTGAQVAAFIDQVSSIVNTMLAQHGFTTPVTDADVLPALRLFVNQEVAAMVEGVNGSGRFGPTIEGRRAGGRKSRFQIILDDVATFIAEFKIGLEQMGATRRRNLASGTGFRDTDESGDSTHPLFQREAFGETYRNWDE